jgi:hypothetical protein
MKIAIIGCPPPSPEWMAFAQSLVSFTDAWARRPEDPNVIVLANSNAVAIESLRELVRAVAQSDARFTKKPDGPSASQSSVWVADLTMPQSGTGSWRAIIYGADNKTYEVGFTYSGNTVTLADDAKEVVRNVSYEAIQNSGDVFAVGNELALDNEGWALILPKGRHIKHRQVSRGGQIVNESYAQLVDDQSLDELLANNESLATAKPSLTQRVKRFVAGIPVFKGHPDLKVHAPQTVGADKDAPIPAGVGNRLRKSERGLETKLTLLDAGIEAVANEGHKFTSALLLVKRTGVVDADGTVEVRPFKIISIGLTPYPNISGVDSLANANANKPAANQNEQKDKTLMKSLLIGWLAAQGIVLANDSTEQAVFDAFNGEMNKRAASITTLGNTKTTLETSLKAERLGRAMAVADLAFAQGKLKAEDREAKVTALANSTDFDKDAKALLGEKVIVTLENSATEFRKKHVESSVDLVITQGKLQLADREKNVNDLLALANDKLEGAIDTLKKLPVKFAVGTALDAGRKQAASNGRNAQEEVLHLANTDDRYKGIKDFGQAMDKILADHPQLKAELETPKASATATAATT